MYLFSSERPRKRQFAVRGYRWPDNSADDAAHREIRLKQPEVAAQDVRNRTQGPDDREPQFKITFAGKRFRWSGQRATGLPSLHKCRRVGSLLHDLKS